MPVAFQFDKSINTFMDTFKFSEVVTRAGLSPFTAQYVLKHPDSLPNMPEGGKQGVHRVFSVEQAFRFALCTLLVQSGVPLKHAGEAVRHCLDTARRHLNVWKKGFVPFESINGASWAVLVAGGSSVQVQLGGRPEKAEFPWYNLEELNFVPNQATPDPILMTSIDLTLLMRRLSN